MSYEFDWSVLWQYRGLILIGLWNTLFLFFFGTVFSVAVGTIVGVCGVARNPILRLFAETYVEFNRNTPLIVKLFFLYFGLALDEFEAAIIGLTLHQSAYIGEVVRAGIQSIPQTQMEAGLSSGLTRIQVMRKIILPQAFVIVIPPMTTQVAEVLKNTPIAMTITIQELTFQIRQIESYSFRGFEAATAATLIYLLIILILAVIAVALEHHFRVRRFRTKTQIAQVLLGTGA